MPKNNISVRQKRYNSSRNVSIKQSVDAETALFLRSSDVTLLFTSAEYSCIRAPCSRQNLNILYTRSAPQYRRHTIYYQNNPYLKQICPKRCNTSWYRMSRVSKSEKIIVEYVGNLKRKPSQNSMLKKLHGIIC